MRYRRTNPARSLARALVFAGALAGALSACWITKAEIAEKIAITADEGTDSAVDTGAPPEE